MGESSGCEKGYIKTGTFGHLWSVLGDMIRALPSFPIIPIPSTVKECELSKDKWKVKRRRTF